MVGPLAQVKMAQQVIGLGASLFPPATAPVTSPTLEKREKHDVLPRGEIVEEH